MRPRDLAALFALAAAWGASYMFIRVAVPALGAVPLVMGRVTIAAAVLWAGIRVMGQRPLLRQHARPLLMLAALNAAVPFTLISLAELRLTASLAAMLTATTPLWAAVLGARFLGERLTPSRIGGLALGFAGVAVLAGWSPVGVSAVTLLAIGAMLVASACYAAAGVWTKLHLTGVRAPTLALGQQLGAAVWLAGPALWRLPDVHPTENALLALLALALLCTTLAYLLYFHLIAAIGPTRTTTVTYLIPLFGAVWGRLFLGEQVTPAMLGGLALILASVLLVNGVWSPRSSRFDSDSREWSSASPVTRARMR